MTIVLFDLLSGSSGPSTACASRRRMHSRMSTCAAGRFQTPSLAPTHRANFCSTALRSIRSTTPSCVETSRTNFGSARMPITVAPVRRGASGGACIRDRQFRLDIRSLRITHLRGPLQEAWLAELERLVAPGAWVLMTIHGQTALDYAGLQPAVYEDPGKRLSDRAYASPVPTRISTASRNTTANVSMCFMTSDTSRTTGPNILRLSTFFRATFTRTTLSPCVRCYSYRKHWLGLVLATPCRYVTCYEYYGG